MHPADAESPGPRCPSCRDALGGGAKICVRCGVHVPSGRPVLMKRSVDRDELEDRSENIVRKVSWLIPFGLYPIGSEAGGHSKPYATGLIAIATLCVSVLFWLGGAGQRRPEWLNDMMLWPKQTGQAPQVVDYKTFREIMREEYGDLLTERELRDLYEEAKDEVLSVRTYRPHQLITHALLHADILHLAGNMVFLLVLGCGINRAIGNVATLGAYVLLAILAAWAHMASEPPGSTTPMLGASGAVMGLAGMYLVLFPLHKIYMVIWQRWGLLVGFRLSHKVFALWGFVAVLFFIAFDVLYTALGVKSNVAHWAHLGGCIAGAGLAVAMLVSRGLHTGGDILSLVLGRFAWPLIGKPVGRVGKKAFWGLW